MTELQTTAAKALAVLVDLDGTLVNIDSVRHFVQNGNSDFDSFHRASIDCPPNAEVVELVRRYQADGLSIIVVTSRSEKYRKLTDFWLATNGIECQELIMRGRYDGRRDSEVKTSMYLNLSSKYKIVAAIDDRQDLLEIWLTLNVESVFKVSEVNGALQRLR